MQDIISCVLLRVPPSGGTLSVTHSALFRLLWFRLFCFVLLCRVIFCFGGIKPPWGGFITPKGVVLTRGVVLSPIRGGYIPPKGWFYPPKGVVLSPIKVGIKPPGVVLRVVLSPIWGWFYARDHIAKMHEHPHFVLHCLPPPPFLPLQFALHCLQLAILTRRQITPVAHPVFANKLMSLNGGFSIFLGVECTMAMQYVSHRLNLRL